jgi:MFS family permease
MLDSHHRGLARKIVWTLFAAQCFGSAGFLAAATINSILGERLTGSASLATVPAAIYQLGTSAAAFGWGYGMDRLGRRGGLTLGLGTGALGALIVTASVVARSLPLFLFGLILMGVAQSALQLARFAAAEVHTAADRGRAISNVVIGGTAGTLVWPTLSQTFGPWMQSLGVDELAWPYLVSFVLFIAAAFVIFILLRPDPRDIGRQLAQLQSEQKSNVAFSPARSILEILRQPAAMAAMAAMVFGQAVMVMVMVITPLHMRGHQHAVPDISLVLSSHVFGMFAFSILSGRLADRWGRGPVILVGAATLILACLTAPLSPDILPLGVALFLLGLGWNFCYVGGSSLLADQLSPEERSRTQGFNDLLIGLVSAVGSFGSGLVFAAVGYGMMGLVGAAAAVIPLALVLWWQVTRPIPATAS